MRVVMTSPYSLSRPGGVQGQVLGLARELRKLGVDVRVVGPCDGPPPEPGVVSVGPSVEWNSNGSVAPISPGRATARRTAEVMRSIEPDVVHLHEPAVPGPCLSALIGFNGPMVGTFHASGELLHMWTRPALRSQMARLSARVVVSESALETARQLVRRRVRRVVERHRGRPLRVGGADADGSAGRVLHRAPRAAQGSRGAARRVAHARSRRGALGRWCRSADRGAARRRAGEERRVARRDHRRRARLAPARRDRAVRAVAARRVVRRGAARGHGGGHAGGRVGDRGLPQRRAPMSTRCSSRPAT